jgi:hypothetical protein
MQRISNSYLEITGADPIGLLVMLIENPPTSGMEGGFILPDHPRGGRGVDGQGDQSAGNAARLILLTCKVRCSTDATWSLKRIAQQPITMP